MTQNLQAGVANMGAEMRDALKSWVVGDGQNWQNVPEHMVVIHCTHSNLQRKMIEIKFDLHMTVGEVKRKLHRHCGTAPDFQRLLLKDGGQVIAELADDSRMLGYYSVESGMTLHIVDEDPFSLSRGGGLEDESQIEKYRMSDEAYAQRKGTVREYIRKQKENDPNWRPPKPNMMTGNPWARQDPAAAAAAAGAAAEEEPPQQPVGPETVEGVAVGNRCEVMPGARRGEVAFVGEVEGLAGGGHWVGVRFDEPVGKSDGCVKGQRIFECEERFGGFVRGRNVSVGDFPADELDLEDSEEEEI